jgi:hypothetical protein
VIVSIERFLKMTALAQKLCNNFCRIMDLAKFWATFSSNESGHPDAEHEKCIRNFGAIFCIYLFL